MTNKTYHSSTASVIASRGNELKADIMEAASKRTNQLSNLCEQVTVEYWDLHNKITDTDFASSSDSIDALEKLGQLAIALKALDEAYSAMSRVGCL